MELIDGPCGPELPSPVTLAGLSQGDLRIVRRLEQYFPGCCGNGWWGGGSVGGAQRLAVKR